MDDAERVADDRRLDSPLDQVRAAILPGMEPEVLPAPVPDEEVERFPRHTAERLLELHPDRYALAVALFFGCPTISGRQVCRIARISPHTLAEIIRREESGRTASEWAKSASARLRALADVAMSVAADQLSDSEACAAAGIKGVASILREATHAHALINERLPGQQARPPAGSPDDYLDSIRKATQSESIEAGKIECDRAADEGSDQVGEGADGGMRDD